MEANFPCLATCCSHLWPLQASQPMIVEEVAGGVIVQAPAKLNLFLEVHSKRGDGYHDIESLMVALDLCDVLMLEREASGRLTLECDEPSLPTDSRNLVMRAAQALAAWSGQSHGARMRLAKHIPAQAGLGGGSSDAAAALVGLGRLWGLETSRDELHALAAGLGSDVPFFLHGGAAICRGRGERVEPIKHSGTFHFVLICPPLGVRTPDVYARVKIPERPRPIGPCMEALRTIETPTLGRLLFNRLQPVAETLVPDLVRVRDTLTSLGSSIDGHLMSGSGSAYFGLCRDKQAAHAAARRLETLGLGTVRVVSCGP